MKKLLPYILVLFSLNCVTYRPPVLETKQEIFLYLIEKRNSALATHAIGLDMDVWERLDNKLMLLTDLINKNKLSLKEAEAVIEQLMDNLGDEARRGSKSTQSKKAHVKVDLNIFSRTLKRLCKLIGPQYPLCPHKTDSTKRGVKQ